MNYPKRKSLRLQNYDYSQMGGYFLTVCTYNRACIMSRVQGRGPNERARIELTELGSMTQNVLRELSDQYAVQLRTYVIMPNHIHILLVMENSGQNRGITVGRFVGAFKSIVSNRWREACTRRGIVMGKLWQRDYYDHIIRNEADYLEKWKYIDENPDKWRLDDLYIEG